MHGLGMEKERFAILGAGKVGTAVGHLLKRSGHDIVAVGDVILENAQRAVAYTGGEPTTDLAQAARGAGCILITTNDDAISDVCRAIAAGDGIQTGDKVIHMSGAGRLDLLQAARQRGASTACIHPLQTFADVESAIAKIPGSTFGITMEESLIPWVSRIVEDLGGKPFPVSDEDKPLYHAAACIASNHFVTLLYLVEEIYGRMGLDRRQALEAVWPLVEGTVENVGDRGTIASLTGPVARGDTGTLRSHIAILKRRFPEVLPVYRSMSLLTADLAAQKGTLHEGALSTIRSHLRGETET